jgi:transcriptional regulator with XRE-family HTH domain
MKMTQPELGRKIAELRKARGLTQEELVEKCNLSVRTLQRIESGEVSPRSYTLKLIFAALDYSVYDSPSPGTRLLFMQVANLFNLRKDTMKKLSVLSMAVAAIALILLALSADGSAQPASKVKKMIMAYDQDFVRWFNTGQVDSLVAMYREDACLLALGCGKPLIREFYSRQISMLKFEELDLTSFSVADSIAVEKGRWRVRLNSGQLVNGEYLTEWRKTGKKWLIVNDISDTF